MPGTLVTPARIAEPRNGESLLTIAARERAGRFENERKLKGVHAWYVSLQRAYGNSP